MWNKFSKIIKQSFGGPNKLLIGFLIVGVLLIGLRVGENSGIDTFFFSMYLMCFGISAAYWRGKKDRKSNEEVDDIDKVIEDYRNLVICLSEISISPSYPKSLLPYSSEVIESALLSKIKELKIAMVRSENDEVDNNYHDVITWLEEGIVILSLFEENDKSFASAKKIKDRFHSKNM